MEKRTYLTIQTQFGIPKHHEKIAKEINDRRTSSLSTPAGVTSAISENIFTDSFPSPKIDSKRILSFIRINYTINKGEMKMK